ncbi:MAG: hypothetical protein ABFD77_04325 [Thermotogota bacterium]
MCDALAIESKLSKFSRRADTTYFSCYQVLKHRLLSVEYAAVGGEGHGPEHITRVLEKLDGCLAGTPIGKDGIRGHELFLALAAVLYHDVGRLRGAVDHPRVSGEIVQAETNSYVLGEEDKEYVNLVVRCHGCGDRLDERLSELANMERTGSHEIDLAKVAALVVLADELDEDCRRADRVLRIRIGDSAAGDWPWIARSRTRGIAADGITHEIDVNLVLHREDPLRLVSVRGIQKSMVGELARRMEYLSNVVSICNKYLPQPMRFRKLLLHVRFQGEPVGAATTAGFQGAVSAQRVLEVFPMLLHQPSRATMAAVVHALSKDAFAEAESQLLCLASMERDLPPDVRDRLHLNAACVYSLMAEETADPSRRRQLLRASAREFGIRVTQGLGGDWAATGLVPENVVHAMGKDGDLRLVLGEERQLLLSLLPPGLRDSLPRTPPKSRSSGGGGCIPLGGEVPVPGGVRRGEEVPEGDEVTCSTADWRPSPGRIGAITVRRASALVKLDDTARFTPSQPLFGSNGVVLAGQVAEGTRLRAEDGSLKVVRRIVVEHGAFEVFDLTVDFPSHRFVSQGVVCHNKGYCCY